MRPPSTPISSLVWVLIASLALGGCAEDPGEIEVSVAPTSGNAAT